MPIVGPTEEEKARSGLFWFRLVSVESDILQPRINRVPATSPSVHLLARGRPHPRIASIFKTRPRSSCRSILAPTPFLIRCAT